MREKLFNVLLVLSFLVGVVLVPHPFGAPSLVQLFGSNSGAAKAVTVDASGNLNTKINAGAVGATTGGTGQTTVTTGDLLYGSATDTWSKLADVATGSVLVSGGVGVAPAWSATPTVTSLTTSTGSITSGLSVIGGASGNIQAANGRYHTWASRNAMGSTADKLWQFLDTAAATGVEMNGGSATLGTCTGGTIVSGSHNMVGGYTGNTSSSCVINFGTPAWTNNPFCFAMSTASTTHPRISAVSTSSITVTGGVSGEAINYFCFGRIAT